MPFPPGERRRVDGEHHRDRRFINLNVGQGQRIFRIRYRFADIDSFHTRYRENVAWPPDGFIDTLQPFERIQLRDFRLLKAAIELRDPDLIANLERAVEDARDREAAEVVAVVEVGHEDLQRAGRIAGGAGDMFHDRLEERTEI